MKPISLIDAQRALIGVISSVEAGLTTPQEAVEELSAIRDASPESFRPDYTLEDFQRIVENAKGSYKPSTDDFDWDYQDEEES